MCHLTSTADAALLRPGRCQRECLVDGGRAGQRRGERIKEEAQPGRLERFQGSPRCRRGGKQGEHTEVVAQDGAPEDARAGAQAACLGQGKPERNLLDVTDLQSGVLRRARDLPWPFEQATPSEHGPGKSPATG